MHDVRGRRHRDLSARQPHHQVRRRVPARVGARRFTNDPGTFTYPSVAAFQAGLGNAFTITLGDRAADADHSGRRRCSCRTASALGANFKLDLGLRYDFIASPTETENKLVVFDAATRRRWCSSASGIDQVHKNGSDFQPRVGVIWNPTGDGGLVVRGAYAVMINQTNTGYVGGSASNPPLATPLNVAGNVRLDIGATPRRRPPASRRPRRTRTSSRAACRRGTSTSSGSSAPTGVMVGYFGSHGDRLRIPININQFVNGVRPYPDAVGDEPDLAGRGARQHHRGAEPRLVALQGPVDHGEPPDDARPAAQRARTRCRSRPTPTRTTAPARTPTDRCRTATTSPTARGRRTSTCGTVSASTGPTSCRSTATG